MMSLHLGRTIALAGSLSLLILAPSLDAQDTFETGTEGWFAGGGPFGRTPDPPPTRVPDGGPEGAGDGYLRITATGGDGPGSRLVAMNASQWARNYLADGILGIGMSLRNFGTTELFLRLLFEDPIPGPPANMAASTSAVFLPVGSDWTDVFFPTRPHDLTPVLGSVDAALANTTLLRLYHGPTATFPPPPVEGVLGVDNIHATVVPEPGTALLLGTGLLLLVGMARLRRGGAQEG